MGCDGGTIPKRDELVRIKKKPEQKDKRAELAFKWKHCSIRQLPLEQPIVACGLGRLYSKQSVLEGLLERTTLPETAQHIKSLKDVKCLNLTENPAYVEVKAEQGDGHIDGGKSPYICPVIGLEMNGKYKFCYLWSCGCVMSERALKHVKTTVCHKCSKPFTESDVVIMNAEEEDLDRMIVNLRARKEEKKSKKKRTNDEVAIKVEEDSCPSTSTSSAGPSTSKKVKKEENGVPRKNGKVEDPAYKKSKDDYSVAQDPSASKVFKSIFTSHKSAKTQEKAHWVTYNPFYN